MRITLDDDLIQFLIENDILIALDSMLREAYEPRECLDRLTAARSGKPWKIDSWYCHLPLGHHGRHKSLKSDGSISRSW